MFVYATIVFLFRLSGKRGLASLDTLDFVVIFLLSNVVQNAVIGNDTSFTGGAIGAVTLVAVNAGVDRLILHSPRAAQLLKGAPTTVIKGGVPDDRAMQRLAPAPPGPRRTPVRIQNARLVDEMQTGVLEPSGQLVLSLKPGAGGDQGRRRRAAPPSRRDRVAARVRAGA